MLEAITFVALSTIGAVDADATLPPMARTVDVVDDVFGKKVADPYRWMEGNDNAELATWLKAQGAYADAQLAKLPNRDALLTRIHDLGMSTGGASGMQLANGRMFFKRIAPGEELPKLVVRFADGTEHVLADPEKLGTSTTHASVNAFTPSPDGKRVAYDLALGGGEISSIRIVDVDSGKELGDVIERVWGEFPAAWTPDSKQFFYTQMAPASKDPKVDPMFGMSAKLHVVGAPVANDVVVLTSAKAAAGFAVAPDEFPQVFTSSSAPYLLAIAGGAHSEVRVAVAPVAKFDTKTGQAPWTTVAEYKDGVESVVFHGDKLYALTFLNASNRKIVATALAKPDLAHADVVLAEDANATIVGIAGAKDALYAQHMSGGRARVVRMPWSSSSFAPIALPFAGWVDDIASDENADGVVVDLEGWTKAGAYYALDAHGAKPTGIVVTTSADFKDVVADEIVVTSDDGAKVPLSILHQRALVNDGTHPSIVYGYGGYGISMTPSFSPTRLAWIEKGGVFAVCHVRGGGERGHKWQVDGTHEHKMNGVHDFIACGEALVKLGFASKDRLFAQGGSMGGVLVGRAITERPDLFAAANIAVGIVNPVRILEAENGANQKSELGDPTTADGFTSILAMDPYQHVVANTAYPAVIFTVGLNDKRVAPWMTAKMAAKLMTSSTSKKPVLVRVEADAGHGVGSTRDQGFRERADVNAFFLANVGAGADPGRTASK